MSVVDMLKISFQKNINCLAVKANFDELGIFIKPEVRNMIVLNFLKDLMIPYNPYVYIIK